jgi:hypothetical protein
VASARCRPSSLRRAACRFELLRGTPHVRFLLVQRASGPTLNGGAQEDECRPTQRGPPGSRYAGDQRGERSGEGSLPSSIAPTWFGRACPAAHAFVDAAHLLAAGLWLGMLVPLLSTIARALASTQPDARRDARRDARDAPPHVGAEMVTRVQFHSARAQATRSRKRTSRCPAGADEQGSSHSRRISRSKCR